MPEGPAPQPKLQVENSSRSLLHQQFTAVSGADKVYTTLYESKTSYFTAQYAYSFWYIVQRRRFITGYYIDIFVGHFLCYFSHAFVPIYSFTILVFSMKGNKLFTFFLQLVWFVLCSCSKESLSVVCVVMLLSLSVVCVVFQLSLSVVCVVMLLLLSVVSVVAGICLYAFSGLGPFYILQFRQWISPSS